MRKIEGRWRLLTAALPLFVLVPAAVGVVGTTTAQAYAQAPAATRQGGTVKAIAGNALTVTTAAGADVTVTVAADARVMQVAPGSTDLKSATPAQLTDVAVGDKVLALGAAGDTPGSLRASRLIVIKATAIAARNEASDRDWQRNGTGGLVKTVAGPEITVASGARTVTITTTPQTIYKRYAEDSVDFANARPATLNQIHPGDQLRARGQLSDDHTAVTAAEIVFGSFENLSGVVSAVDTTAGTLTLTDLTTKKTVTVNVTAKSDLRNLPAEAAARFTARNNPGAAAAGAGGAGSGAGRPAGAQAEAGGAGAGAGRYSGRRAGADLSQMLQRLPTETLAEVKPGSAVMIVAAQGAGANPTAVTLLSGVEPILSATPAGQRPISISPFNFEDAAGAGEGAGGGGPR